MGGTGTWELEGVDDGLHRAVDAVAIRPWRAKLYEIFSNPRTSWLTPPSGGGEGDASGCRSEVRFPYVQDAV